MTSRYYTCPECEGQVEANHAISEGARCPHCDNPIANPAEGMLHKPLVVEETGPPTCPKCLREANVHTEDHEVEVRSNGSTYCETCERIIDGEARRFEPACPDCGSLCAICEHYGMICQGCACLFEGESWETDRALAMELAPSACEVIREVTSMMVGVSDAHSMAREVLCSMINADENTPAVRCTECGGLGCLDVLSGQEEPKCLWCVAASIETKQEEMV